MPGSICVKSWRLKGGVIYNNSDNTSKAEADRVKLIDTAHYKTMSTSPHNSTST